MDAAVSDVRRFSPGIQMRTIWSQVVNVNTALPYTYSLRGRVCGEVP